METLGEYLKNLRGQESLRDASKRIGISHTYLDTIEKGFDKRSGKPVKPTPETLKLISKAYYCDYEDLMIRAGYLEDDTDNGMISEKKAPYSPQLTEKDESDIGKRMEKIKKDLLKGNTDDKDGLSFMGEPLSEEAIESLLEALEHAERIATLTNKKFIPKKYRK